MSFFNYNVQKPFSSPNEWNRVEYSGIIEILQWIPFSQLLNPATACWIHHDSLRRTPLNDSPPRPGGFVFADALKELAGLGASINEGGSIAAESLRFLRYWSDPKCCAARWGRTLTLRATDRMEADLGPRIGTAFGPTCQLRSTEEEGLGRTTTRTSTRTHKLCGSSGTQRNFYSNLRERWPH